MTSSRSVFPILLTLLLVSGEAQAKTSISWWQFWTDPDIKPVVEEIVGAFEKENPEVDVTLTDLTWANGQEKIAIAFASGTGPDVVEVGSDWIAQFAASGQFADLGEFIASDSDQFQGWSMGTYQGKVYAKPWILGTRVIFGNRDILAKAGFDSNYVPIDLNEFFGAILKVQKLGGGIYGWGSNTAEKHRLYKKYLPFFWSIGGQLFTDDGKYCLLASDHAVQALRGYKAIHDSAGYVGTQRAIEDAFLDGKIGFIMSGDWLLKRIRLENRKINFMTTLFPGQGYPGKSFLGGEFLAVNAASEQKQAAMKLVEFITAPENQLRFCRASSSTCPSSKIAQKDSRFATEIHTLTFIRQLRFANHTPVDPNWPLIEQNIEGAIERALFGDGQSAQALYDARNAITASRVSK